MMKLLKRFIDKLWKIGGAMRFRFVKFAALISSLFAAKKQLPTGSSSFDKIEHFFVLMMENRSFDHMLGFSGIEGVDGLTGDEYNEFTGTDGTVQVFKVNSNAAQVFSPDAPHEFEEIKLQLLGNGTGSYSDDKAILNSGFVKAYAGLHSNRPSQPGAIMQCFNPRTLPILTTLAKKFAVCDRWFSSLPGPTWPNRFFIHAATSGGLDDSPTVAEVLRSYVGGFEFSGGTIFTRLSKKDIPWRVYHGDALPQTLALKGMKDDFLLGDRFRDFECFEKDLNSNETFPNYVFIEPNHGNSLEGDTTKGSSEGNSQHPVGSVADGELLIKRVYEAIRKSPKWEKCCLLITYDEHGGFYDHVAPPSATPPGDGTKYNKKNFDFSRYGVRVPAVIISPFIREGTVDKNIHDHASLARTLGMRFGFEPLAARDAPGSTSLSFADLFLLDTPRTDLPELPEVFRSGGFGLMSSASQAISTNEDPIDLQTAGFLQIAKGLHVKLEPAAIPQIDKRVADIIKSNNKGQARAYMQEVQEKVKAKRNEQG